MKLFRNFLKVNEDLLAEMVDAYVEEQRAKEEYDIKAYFENLNRYQECVAAYPHEQYCSPYGKILQWDFNLLFIEKTIEVYLSVKLIGWLLSHCLSFIRTKLKVVAFSFKEFYNQIHLYLLFHSELSKRDKTILLYA